VEVTAEELVRASRFVAHREDVRGSVYDVDTGKVREMVVR